MDSSINNIPPQTTTFIVEVLVAVLIITTIVLTIFFILSQQKLARKLSQATNTPKIDIVLLWSQVIPLWSYVALVIVGIKLDKQLKLYTEKYQKKLKFKASLIYWYVGFTLLNFVPGLNLISTVASLILFVVVWSRITKSAKQIKEIYYRYFFYYFLHLSEKIICWTDYI